MFVKSLTRYLKPNSVLKCTKRFSSGRRMDCAPWATYDDVPSPKGDYKKLNAALQRAYNYHLLIGISSLAITMAFGICTDMFFMNWAIPERPADIENYKG